MRFIRELDPEMVGIGRLFRARHSVWRGGGRNVGRDTVSFRAASPAEAESAASGDDSARNDSSDGTRTGDSGRRKRRDAEPVSGSGWRAKYMLYDNKICTGDEAAECINCMKRRMESIGYEVVIDRGDYKG